MSDNLPAVFDVQSLEVMAKQVANSRLFGLDPAQAFTLMLLAQSKGMHPIQAVERYHVIQGKPAMKADAMLAEFQARGGNVEWTKDSDAEVEGVFTHPAHAPKGNVSRFTIADAKRADLTKNPMWSKYPNNMLRARVISNGIRKTMPGIVAGIYTPEEVTDFDDRPRHVQARAFVEATAEALPAPEARPRKKDGRPYYKLAAGGVEKTNAEFREQYPEAADVVNGFELDRHMLKAALAAKLMEDPGKKARPADVQKALSLFYGTDEGYAWIRREMPVYLAGKLEEAREKAVQEDQGDDFGDDLVEVEGGELVPAAEAPVSREPGEDG